MTLQLTCPLVVLDLETTGLDPKFDRIVQIGIIKVYPDGEEKEWTTLIDPGIPIPPEVSKIHGITDGMVTGAPKFPIVAQAILKGFQNCHFAGFNLKFDLDFLQSEFRRVYLEFDTSKIRVADACAIFKMKHPRNLYSAVLEYLGSTEADIFEEKAHNALEDCRATLKVLRAQLKRHPELPQDIDGLHALAFETPKPGFLDQDGKIAWRNGQAVIAFGNAQNGIPLNKVPREFLRWMLKSNFSHVVKQIVQDALEGKFPVKND